MAEDINKPKTFAEIEAKTEESLNQFVFVVFVPNPMTKTVRLWIDGDSMESFMSTDRFLSIIELTCGNKEKNKLDVACHEYGTPYIYDRENRKLEQLTELPNEKRIELDINYHKKFEKDSNPYSVNRLFNNTKGTIDSLKQFGLPDFSKK